MLILLDGIWQLLNHLCHVGSSLNQKYRKLICFESLSQFAANLEVTKFIFFSSLDVVYDVFANVAQMCLIFKQLVLKYIFNVLEQSYVFSKF